MLRIVLQTSELRSSPATQLILVPWGSVFLWSGRKAASGLHGRKRQNK